MSCRKWERWISDAQDGVLNPRRRHGLDVHLETCPECQGYAARLRVLQIQVRAGEEGCVTPQEAADMFARLREQLHAAAGQETEPVQLPSGTGRRWAWFGAAASVAAAAALLFLVLVRPGPDFQGQEVVFSLDEAVELAFAEFGSEQTRLEDTVEALLASSLNGLPDEPLEGIGPFFQENPLLWEELTEEELRFLEEEIKKEIKS